jgi:hypothetical protein
MEPAKIKSLWVGISGLGALIGATIAVASFPGAAFAENPTGQFDWHLVGFALSIGISFALAQWLLLSNLVADKRVMNTFLSGLWLIASTAGIVAILFPLWWMPWGQIILAPYWTVAVMIPGSLVLGFGQRMVLGQVGKASNRYVWLTCFGVATGGYLGLIGAFLLMFLSDALLPINHMWALLFGLIVGAFQCRPLERTIKSVAVDESS